MDVESAEGAYRRFLNVTAPLWLWIVVAMPAVTMVLVLVIIDAIGRGFNISRLGDRFEPPYAMWQHVWPVTSLVIVYFAIRGRHELKALLAGRLSFFQIVFVGLGASFVMLAVRWVTISVLLGRPASEVTVFDALHVGVRQNIIAPLREELFFQGVLQTALQKTGAVWAVVITSIVFALYHLPNTDVALGMTNEQKLHYLIELSLVLSVLAIVRQRTKSLAAAIVAHGSYNALGSFLNLDPPY